MEEKKTKGCLSVFVKVFLITFVGLGLIVLLFSCFNNGNKQEQEWIEQLREEKKAAEQLYASNASPEEKAAQARAKMLELENEYSAIQDETGKNQMDYPLIRAYVDVREMYVALKHMAENDEYDKFYNEYFEANNEAEQILRDDYESY